MSAITTLFLALLQSGDHVVVSDVIYGGTVRLLRQILSNLDIAASFVDSRHGWAIGNSGQVLRTFDGGQSWVAQSANVETDLLDVKFIDVLEGWIAGNEGLLLHTRDGGRHWSAEATDSTHALERLFILDRNNGWAVGFGGTILKYGPAQAPRLKALR